MKTNKLKYTLSTLALSVGLLLASGGCAHSSEITKFGEPGGHMAYCSQHVLQCASQTPATLSSDLSQLIRRVNDEVNRGVQGVKDSVQFGVPEKWTDEALQLGRGDCEDFALAKRKRLVELGVPRGALRLAVVDKFSWDMTHVVLLVSFEDKVVVMDSLTSRLEDAQDLGVTWLNVQHQSNPRVWYKKPSKKTLDKLLTTITKLDTLPK